MHLLDNRSLWDEDFILYFTDEETEAHRGCIAFPKSPRLRFHKSLLGSNSRNKEERMKEGKERRREGIGDVIKCEQKKIKCILSVKYSIKSSSHRLLMTVTW